MVRRPEFLTQQHDERESTYICWAYARHSTITFISTHSRSFSHFLSFRFFTLFHFSFQKWKIIFILLSSNEFFPCLCALLCVCVHVFEVNVSTRKELNRRELTTHQKWREFSMLRIQWRGLCEIQLSNVANVLLLLLISRHLITHFASLWM